MNVSIETPKGYTAFNPETIKAYVVGHDALRSKIGPEADALKTREVGDGNLNLVFIVEGPEGSAVIKQALPYVRLVGESWPLPLKRSFFEYHALTRQTAVAPDLVPEIYHYDEANALIAMEYLTPHIILRKGLIAGTRYPRLPADLGRFMAETLFRTSDLHMSAAQRKKDLALFADNIELCDITESLVFTDPYRDAPLNSWTSPQLDSMAQAMRDDRDAKVAVQEMKHTFTTKAQALVHGDLHTGSVMVTESDTRVIDPEFAFYGPMGFDIGALLANYFLAFFSQAGHESNQGERAGYEDWILATTQETWTVFEEHFRRLWRTERTGILFPTSLFEEQGDQLGAEQALTDFMRALLSDTIGFAGAKMIRRLLGLAHVEDMQSIADPDRRAVCEARALRMGRQLLVGRDHFSSIAGLCDLARIIRSEDGTP